MKTRTRGMHPLLIATVVAISSLATAGCFGRYGFVGVGTAIDVLPHGYVSVMVGTMPYYYDHGVFYRPYRHGYVVVPAPIGATLIGPPPGSVLVLVENDPFHYYHGVFYAPRANRYVVVRPPIGAFVRSVPETAATRRIGGVEYKEYAGTYYRPAIHDGHRGYQVADPPMAMPREGR